MPEEDLVDIKFRLYDGSDIGPFRYSSASTVDMLKQRIVSDWPKGKTITPKVVNEIKLICSGKILDNNKTVGQCRTPFGEVAGGIVIMHVVVQPSLAKTKTDTNHPAMMLLDQLLRSAQRKYKLCWPFRYLVGNGEVAFQKQEDIFEPDFIFIAAVSL